MLFGKTDHLSVWENRPSLSMPLMDLFVENGSCVQGLLVEKKKTHWSCISVGKAVFEFIDQDVQNIKNIVLINDSRTAWPTKILIPFFVSQTICFKMRILNVKQC